MNSTNNLHKDNTSSESRTLENKIYRLTRECTLIIPLYCGKPKSFEQGWNNSLGGRRFVSLTRSAELLASKLSAMIGGTQVIE